SLFRMYRLHAQRKANVCYLNASFIEQNATDECALCLGAGTLSTARHGFFRSGGGFAISHENPLHPCAAGGSMGLRRVTNLTKEAPRR
ncbi:hypothetical protein, partial [Ensifer aridi]|uniref:hypothetical protein n=1 Tax=Ensifer aridi TaxID=1708715 RepID=UPI001AECE4B1